VVSKLFFRSGDFCHDDVSVAVRFDYADAIVGEFGFESHGVVALTVNSSWFSRTQTWRSAAYLLVCDYDDYRELRTLAYCSDISMSNCMIKIDITAESNMTFERAFPRAFDATVVVLQCPSKDAAYTYQVRWLRNCLLCRAVSFRNINDLSLLLRASSCCRLTERF
jgi:hypothetical protein